MRQSNIELCRIASIALVLLVHSAFSVNGFPQTLDASSFWLIVLESMSIIGVNVFIFISGFFSIKLKPKTIHNIVFICAFYFCILTTISLLLGKPFLLKNLLFISHSHGFILDYTGLILLSPILNKYVENTDKKSFLTLLILLISFQTYFGYIIGANSRQFNDGYGLVSYSIIYLIARYINLYGINPLIKKYSGIIYLLATISLIGIACFFLHTGHPNYLRRLYAYYNPIIIISAISFFLFFEKMSIKPNKFINHIAKSTLGILLFHAAAPASPTIWRYMKTYFQSLTDNFHLMNILYWGLGIIIIMSAAIVVDQLRLYLSDKTYYIINKKQHGL